MSLTKYDSIETQRNQLQYYQALITEHAKEYSRIGHQLYKKDTMQSALKTLLGIVNSLEDIDIALKNLYKSTPNSLHKTLLPLPLKNSLLLARIKERLLLLHNCLIIKRPDDAEPPSFDTVQGDLGWCMDAVIFYKENVFYISQTTRSLQTITVAKNKQEKLNQIKTNCAKLSLMLADSEEFAFFHTLHGVTIEAREKCVDYIDLVKMAEARIPYINYKNDEMLQVETYYALTQATRFLKGNIKEQELVSRYPTIMETFINKCSDNIVKLSYYHSLILQESENAKPAPLISLQVKEYSKIFLDVYGKVMNEFNRLKRANKLDPQQKADYLKANYYAHYVRLATYPSLQGNTISKALDDFTKNDDNKNYVKKYISIAAIERDTYFSNNTEIFLCQDIQEIINDMHAIYDYFDVTQQICTALTNQISVIMQLWYKIKDTPDSYYKETLYNEACTYLSICLQYYACYTLIHNYLTEGDESISIRLEFDENMRETQALFLEFRKERDIIFALDKRIETEVINLAKNNAKDLQAMYPQTPRAPRKPHKKIQIALVENKKLTQNPTTKKPQDDKEAINVIDIALEEGRQCISKNNNQGATAYFWKAYNLATNPSNVKRRLEAMDGLCCLASSELAKRLKGIELLSKDPQKKGAFQTEAIALLTQLPKLKNTYEQYFQLANTHNNRLSPNEQEAIAHSRDLFWTQFITVQSKLQLLLEQHTKKNASPSKKSQPIKSNKNNKPYHTEEDSKTETNLQFVLEKHFDDLASERKLSTHLADKENEPQQFKITLPQNIQCIFEFLAPFKGTHYLVGSMVLQLLVKEHHLLPVVAHDADFISTCTDRASLIIAGFQENYYMRNLYSLYRQFEWPIDLVALPEEENWLQNSLNSRDFRVAALSCDKDGTILDPTGKGLDDLKQRRLVMIGNPVQRIKQDPVLLLRALKYMVFGFKPDEALIHAIESWQPQPEINFSKLSAVTRKHLIKPDEAELFLDLLCQYNLLYKIFGLKVKQELMPLLGLTPKATSVLCQQSLFNNSQKEQKNEDVLLKQSTVFHS